VPQDSSSQQETLKQGDLRLLQMPVAQELLESALPARLAYVAKDGTPRIVPTWFHWDGEELVMPTFIWAPHVPKPAARLAVLRGGPDVAVSIDTNTTPPRILQVRGKVSVTDVDGVAPEYAAAARKYLGEEQASGYLASIDVPGTRMARIAVRPVWASLLDFETRLPGGMGG
jgi:pyridoxamine 5'-phosphate oxidase-like protein